jgi:hypothetical protein
MWVGGRRPEDPVYPNRATEPTTAAGSILLDAFRTKATDPDFAIRLSAESIIRHAIPCIEAEARAQEAERWRRIPGTYRLDEQTTEVVVDVPEAASFLVDEFPDEVALIQREAVAAALARIEDRLMALYPEHRAAVALVCDEAIDRSGAMLGRIRDKVIGR